MLTYKLSVIEYGFVNYLLKNFGKIGENCNRSIVFQLDVIIFLVHRYNSGMFPVSRKKRTEDSFINDYCQWCRQSISCVVDQKTGNLIISSSMFNRKRWHNFFDFLFRHTLNIKRWKTTIAIGSHIWRKVT